MMILSDTDILSALAKVNQIELLYSLLGIEQLYIVPAVFAELEMAKSKQFLFTELIFNTIETRRIEVVALTPSESAFSQTLSQTLGLGERESIAAAHQRNGVLLSNESRVAHWCRRLGVECFGMPLLLRALWAEEILTQAEVRQLIADLYSYDRMSLSAKNMTAIFAPKK